MINNVNHLILIGTLAKDAKVSETKDKVPMTILSVVTSSEWIENGQKKTKSLWNKIFFFGDDALLRVNYKKGMVVQITAEAGERALSENGKSKYQTMLIGTSSWVIDFGNANRPSPEVDEEIM